MTPSWIRHSEAAGQKCLGGFLEQNLAYIVSRSNHNKNPQKKIMDRIQRRASSEDKEREKRASCVAPLKILLRKHAVPPCLVQHSRPSEMTPNGDDLNYARRMDVNKRGSPAEDQARRGSVALAFKIYIRLTSTSIQSRAAKSPLTPVFLPSFWISRTTSSKLLGQHFETFIQHSL